MVEPFGCVVMLHWRLPRLRSSRFQLPFPSSLSLSLFHPVELHIPACIPLQPSPIAPVSRFTAGWRVQRSAFRKRLKRNAIIRQYIIIAFDEPGNCVTLNERSAHISFYTRPDSYRSIISPTFIERYPCSNRESVFGGRGRFPRLLRGTMIARGVVFECVTDQIKRSRDMYFFSSLFHPRWCSCSRVRWAKRLAHPDSSSTRFN